MKRSPQNALGACALLVLGACATTQSGAQRAPDAVQILSTSTRAQRVQRDAPAAYAEFAVALESARALRGAAQTQALADAELLLAWGETQARVSVAQRRRESAAVTEREATEQLGRAERQVTALNSESETRERASAANIQAQNATQSPDAMLELEQQTQLALGAAAVMGVDTAALRTLRARLEASATLTPAAKAQALAEIQASALTLVRDARPSRDPSDAAMMDELEAVEPSVDPRRDTRGVVLTLRALFDARGALVPTAAGRLAVVTNALRAHPTLRARVEAYASNRDPVRARTTATDQARRVREAIVGRGIETARVEHEGVVRTESGARREDVVEIVLIAGS
ncbi:MAG: hypothetical protein Q8Q09_22625 [Deltaproteobacteria bacterium]|nr:hypothetical protein [Deltaproteobacteria bacterium]